MSCLDGLIFESWLLTSFCFSFGPSPLPASPSATFCLAISPLSSFSVASRHSMNTEVPAWWSFPALKQSRFTPVRNRIAREVNIPWLSSMREPQSGTGQWVNWLVNSLLRTYWTIYSMIHQQDREAGVTPSSTSALLVGSHTQGEPKHPLRSMLELHSHPG